MTRYYMGVDWADREHQLYVGDETGGTVTEMTVQELPEAMAQLGRWLDECRATGIELWAAIEKPHGRLVDFLLDHGVVIYPVNPKALNRVRDRYRMSPSKSDPFDARVLSDFLRTDHVRLRALQPNSEAAQELKLLTSDHHRLVRHKTRLLNQLTVTLKECYPRPLEVFPDLEAKIALAFLEQYPSSQALSALTRRTWTRFATRQHHLRAARCQELWEKLSQPQGAMPEHVVRAKTPLLAVLVRQLTVVGQAVESYREQVERFFAAMPAAKLAETLPGGKTGITVRMLWAELGDAPSRWASFRHLQAEAGGVPVTKASGKSRVVHFRVACNKRLRYAVYWFAFNSLKRCEWANRYYRDQRARGHRHPQALRALGAKWLKIIFVMWRDHKPYDETYHLANITRQRMRQAA